MNKRPHLFSAWHRLLPPGKPAAAPFVAGVLAVLATLGLLSTPGTRAAPTDIAAVPLAQATTATVKPNLMMILDNSGSMASDYMPDYVGDGTDMCKTGGTTLGNCSQTDPAYFNALVNGVFYNPTISYAPAVNYDGTSRTSYGSPWTSVPYDAFGVSTVPGSDRYVNPINLVTGYPDTVFCNDNLSNRTGSSTTSTESLVCTGSGTVTFTSGRTFTCNCTSGRRELVKETLTNATSTQITEGGVTKQVALSGTSALTHSTGGSFGSTQPTGNSCTTSSLSNVALAVSGGSNSSTPTTPQKTGPSDDASGSVCRAPVQGSVWRYPNADFSNRQSISGNPYYYTTTSFLWCSTRDSTSGFGTGSIASGTCSTKQTSTFRYPQYGTWTRVDIVSTTATYPKAAGRTDCTPSTSTSCTYAQEMTNFANWYAYYKTRIQMMKTSSGRAFQTVDDKFRVGFITINPSNPVAASRFLAVSDFTAGAGNQKDLWYQKFYAQGTPNSTPLREALSRVGRYFAHQTNGINRGMSDDPMQYYCQSNYAILSTDGLWNNDDETVGPVKLDGTTPVGDQDSNPAITPRPLLDSTGNSSTVVTTSSIFKQLVCTGNSTTNFGTSDSGSAESACGCPGNQKKVIQREYQSTTTATTLSGHTSTATTYNNLFTDIVACSAASSTVSNTANAGTSEALVCTKNATVTFTSGRTYTCSCNSNKRVLVQETTTGGSYSTETDDGVTTVLGFSPGASSLKYSVNGTSFSGTAITGNSCTGNSLSAVAFAVTSGTVTNTTTSGTAVTNAMITLSPNPKTVNQAPTTTITNLGAANTLADVAQYYYATDLRPNGSMGTPVGASGTQFDVGTGSADIPGSSMQRMSTFTIGLGVDGTLSYDPNYDTASTGDFAALRNGTLNWPVPSENQPTAVDDLWHAAVNGRGKYFSARDPNAVTVGLSTALQNVQAVVGAGASAATSSLKPTPGDNLVYVGKYETVTWSGDLEAHTIDDAGNIAAANIWSPTAQSQLDTRDYTTRVIKRFKTGATNNLQDFLYSNLTTAEQAYFNAPYITTGANQLSQWSTLTSASQTNLQGQNLVNFLLGDNSNNGTLYRIRTHKLGDVIDAQPTYVKKTNFTNWTDTGYAAFSACINDNSSSCAAGVYGGTRPRPPMVYVGANDGMLHAFNGTTGAEMWAYIPNIVMPNLYRLADLNYANRHIYMVDGSPTVSDVYDSVAAKWRTILVGGLSSGGRGYYALDITDPANPIGLWEFNVRAAASCPSAVVLNTSKDDCDLGYSYGNPVITKLSDGTWVVLLTSGYNNISPGDGKGYLYVVNPVTGVILKKIQTSNTSQALSPGSGTTPSGFVKIANFVNDVTTNNTTLRVYGGDLQGNLWRIDPSAGTAYAIAVMQDASAAPQPISTKPELGEVISTAGTTEMVYVATGLFLGVSDTASTQLQTIYAIKDSSDGTTAPSPVLNARTSSTIKVQTLTTPADPNAGRQLSQNTVDITAAGTNGWRVDLPVSGERVNVDPVLELGTLIVASNVPANTICAPGGFSFVNFIDYRTGSYVPGSTTASMSFPNYLIVGLAVFQTASGGLKGVITGSGGQLTTVDVPINVPQLFGRRVGWRELVQ